MTRIFYFGRLADHIGTGQEQYNIPANIVSAGELRSWLGARGGGYTELLDERIKIAADNIFVDDKASITDVQEIAFMPPVGGG